MNAVPKPEESNFCGSGPGLVEEDFDRNFHEGNWSVTTAINPEGKQEPFLVMQGTTSGAVSVARPGGFIKLIDCEFLITSQPDREGGPFETITTYYRSNPTEPRWVDFI